MRIFLFLAALLAGPALSALASENVRLTIYDDGLSCPGDCDAHVVFHPSLNGTEFAHHSSTPIAPYAKCVNGKSCQICIEPGGKQCLTVTYRGTGPTKMTFDLTPSFYEEACQAQSNPPALARKCKELAAAAAGLLGRTNCIRSPANPKCKAIIESAQAAQQTDRTNYDECKKQGAAKYNATRPVSERRLNDCAYELRGTGGPNSKGTFWKRLLPGACRTGTFVGRDGLDCCTGRHIADGPLGVECRGFYPK